MLQPEHMAKFMGCHLHEVCAWKGEIAQQSLNLLLPDTQVPDPSSGTRPHFL